MPIIKLCLGGTALDPELEEFRFRTVAEAQAFLSGVNIAIGYFSVRIARHNLAEYMLLDGDGYPVGYVCDPADCEFSETCPQNRKQEESND